MPTITRYVHAQDAHFALVEADDQLLATLRTYGVLDQIRPVYVFATMEETFTAYGADMPVKP